MKKILTFKEAKALLNTTTGHLRSLIHQKKIPYIKLNKLIRFDYEDLSKWIDAQKKESK